MSVPNLTVVSVTPDARIYNERPNGQAPSALLLHHTGGVNSLKYLSTYHANPVSIHKLVPKVMPDGNPGHYQIVSDSLRAWHAGISEWGGKEDWNDCAIGIEIENLGTGKDPYTDQQYETVAQIIAYHTALYHIGDKWVRDHKEVALPRGRKSDVDPTFSHARMWARVYEIRQSWPVGWPALWACYDRS